MLFINGILTKINRVTRIAAAILIAQSGSALASDLPKFDGVYLQESTGGYIELRPMNFKWFNVCGEQGNVFTLRLADAEQVEATPRTARDVVDNIFIRSREERLAFVSYAVPVSSFLRPLSNNPNAALTTPHEVLGPCEQSGIFPREIIPINWEDRSVADSNCGYSVDRFRILSEFENTAQYFARESVDIRHKPAPALGECGISNTIRTEGIFIKTNLNTYFIRYRNPL